MNNKKDKFYIENIFLDINRRLGAEAKQAALITFFIGLLCHFKFLAGYWFNEDHAFKLLYSANDYARSGRWGIRIVGAGLRSAYINTVIIGLSVLLSLSIISAIVIKIYNIKSRISIFLISGIISSFPIIAYYSAYTFCFDSYMAGYMIAMAAVFLANRKSKISYIMAVILMMFSLSTYQAVLSFIVLNCMILCLADLLNREDMRKVTYRIFRFLIFIILGLISYVISLKVINSMYNLQLASYKGIDKIGTIDLNKIPQLIALAYKNFIEFFFGEKFYYISSYMSAAYIICILSTFIIIAVTVYKKQIYKGKIRMFLIIIIIITFPIGANIVNLAAPTTDLNTLLVYQMVFIILMPVILLESDKDNDKFKIKSFNILSVISSAAVFIIFVNYAVITNIYYMKAETLYKRTMSLTERIFNRIEMLDGYNADMKLAVVGDLKYNDNYPKSLEQFEMIKNDIGLRNPFIGYGLGRNESNTYKICQMIDRFLGVNINPADEAEIDNITKNPLYYSAGVWPQNDSVKIIDGYIVVNLITPISIDIDKNEEKLIFSINNTECLEEGSKFKWRIYRKSDGTRVFIQDKFTEDMEITYVPEDNEEYYAYVVIKNPDNTINTSVYSISAGFSDEN